MGTGEADEDVPGGGQLRQKQGGAFSTPRAPVLERSQNPQIFYEAAVVWKHLTHPNIVPLLSAIPDPLQLTSDWMPGGDLTRYITNHPDADRVALVRVPHTVSYDTLTPLTSCLISPKALTTFTPAM